MQTAYPAAPANVPAGVTEPSSSFKKGVSLMIVYIVLFMIIYTIMLALGVAIAALLGYIGGIIVLSIHNLFAIIFGAGLIVAGLMVLYFMVKFIFENKKAEMGNYTEIFEHEHPRLFEFVRKVSEETGTQFPKHIYVSPEVNACVFYDSNFLSMFLPVKKNLMIGAGLVNMVNMSEFKAVIAHEFGHFSQKSMKAGSFVYQVNKVIYNMLFENDSYHDTIVKWANIHSAFAICARITISIVRAVQWVQQQAYVFVNKQYSVLSREMEYHADAVAASVAGGNNAVHALYRIDFADTCYNNVIARYNAWIPEKKKGDNVFAHQRIMALQLADELKFPLNNNLPVIATNAGINTNKVSVENQWASHPTLEQRKEALDKLGVTATVVEESPWTLFNDAQRLQEMLTTELYKAAPGVDEMVLTGDSGFKEAITEERAAFAIPELYGAFYSSRDICKIDLYAPAKDHNIDDISKFFTEKAELVKHTRSATEDVGLLDEIIVNSKYLRSFSYNGEKMPCDKAAMMKTTREAESSQLQAELQAADEAVYYYFMERALARGESDANELKTLYRYYYKITDSTKDQLKFCGESLQEIQKLYDGEMITEQVCANLASVKRSVFDRIETTKNTVGGTESPYKVDTPKEIVGLLDAQYDFSSTGDALSEAVNNLNALLNEYAEWRYQLNRKSQKQLLEKQAEYVSN